MLTGKEGKSRRERRERERERERVYVSAMALRGAETTSTSGAAKKERMIRGGQGGGGDQGQDQGAGGGNAAASSAASPTPGQKFWLNAYHDRVAGIFARSDSVCLCDVFGDYDKRLVVVDAKQKKLKLWKGTTLEAELKLVDNPVALCSVYGDNSRKRIPALCVAAGPHLYIYRNLRAYYKFTLPDLVISDSEKEIWNVS